MSSAHHTARPGEVIDNPDWYSRCCTDLANHKPQPGRMGAMKAVLTNASRLWNNGQTLTVSFVRPAGTKTQQDKVKEVVKEWEKYANLKFQFLGNNNRNANIRIAFDPEDGSWSYVGRDNLSIPKTQNTMNFGWVRTQADIDEDDRGVILHEFGHAIGYLHEHQSPRRAEKLTLKEKAVIEYYTRTQGWDEKTVRQQILNVYNLQDISNFSIIDLTSIMMYFMPGAMNEENIDVPPNNALSPYDKAFAALNYPFIAEGANAEASNAKVEAALATLGVQDEFKQSILAEFAQKDWEGVRAEFTRWSVNEKALAEKEKAKETPASLVVQE
ncbi:hypothetical protein EST38_g11205 [Candolleomyces aberdarensis]|uniref:Peptidase metallopeptidase domain-containing protein n=1 Tax=Candolleomyces aberdarensis TaxID=2316362 RepID=A0A4Q2D5F1_9AGAR|nr:hypothetical protein EST38_g11205 [Candolleomyces aberdarensis]